MIIPGDMHFIEEEMLCSFATVGDIHTHIEAEHTAAARTQKETLAVKCGNVPESESESKSADCEDLLEVAVRILNEVRVCF